MDMEDYENNKPWVSVYGLQKAPHDDTVRGSYILFVDAHKLDKAWAKASGLTEMGELGYMTSLSPGPMTWGDNKGKYTIAVHTLHEYKRAAYKTLVKAKLFKYFYDYRLVKRFRYQSAYMDYSAFESSSEEWTSSEEYDNDY